MKTKFTFYQERQIESFLKEKLHDSYFVDFDSEIEKSDEIGHSHGPGVQKIVGKLLSDHLEVEYEKNKKGENKKRAFSDNIINGFINNVKFTIKENGCPNLVSMNRMIKHVFDKKNDTYYVTMIYYNIINKLIDVKFVNILQFIDCLIYNSGPGQMMIKQELFISEYNKYINNLRPIKNYSEITKDLAQLIVVERQKHITLRQKQLDIFKKNYL